MLPRKTVPIGGAMTRHGAMPVSRPVQRTGSIKSLSVLAGLYHH
jgi:hypothetical protein